MAVNTGTGWSLGKVNDTPATAPPQHFITIDLETTGLSSRKNGICQIGAVAATETGEIVSLYSQDVYPSPGLKIEAEAMEVNGFSSIRLYSGKYEHEALPEFLKWKDQFSGQTPVAIFHNAPFDVGFLQAAFERYELDAGRFLRRVRDTATMSPNVFGEKDYPRSLEEICKRLNIVKLGNHDALHDALATHKAFFAMKKILDERRPAAWLLNKQSLWNIFTPDPALVPYGVIRGY